MQFFPSHHRIDVVAERALQRTVDLLSRSNVSVSQATRVWPGRGASPRRILERGRGPNSCRKDSAPLPRRAPGLRDADAREHTKSPQASTINFRARSCVRAAVAARSHLLRARANEQWEDGQYRCNWQAPAGRGCRVVGEGGPRSHAPKGSCCSPSIFHPGGFRLVAPPSRLLTTLGLGGHSHRQSAPSTLLLTLPCPLGFSARSRTPCARRVLFLMHSDFTQTLSMATPRPSRASRRLAPRPIRSEASV